VRTLAVAGTGATGRRSLLAVELRWRPAGALAIRCGRCVAWGDPVDLVTALSPLPGRLVPRHWGAWREELWTGVTWGDRRASLAAAVHLRRPRIPAPDGIEAQAAARWRW
jgi:hypothetical protein